MKSALLAVSTVLFLTMGCAGSSSSPSCPAGKAPTITGSVTGKAGQPTDIFGTNLGGNSAVVTINGVSASNQGGDDGSIQITIPAAAKSGTLNLSNGTPGCSTSATITVQ
jgi:hypothetical protein